MYDEDGYQMFNEKGEPLKYSKWAQITDLMRLEIVYTYGGYYSVGDTNALRDLMLKTEASREFVERLEAQCHALLPRFTIEQEHESWYKLIAKLT